MLYECFGGRSERLTPDWSPCFEQNFQSRALEELSHINESLRRREALLVASAKASRMLLEAPDVRGAMPEVLRAHGRGGRCGSRERHAGAPRTRRASPCWWW